MIYTHFKYIYFAKLKKDISNAHTFLQNNNLFVSIYRIISLKWEKYVYLRQFRRWAQAADSAAGQMNKKE